MGRRERREARHDLAQDRDRVLEPSPRRLAQDGRRRGVAAAALQGDQATGQVAAVHRRHVLRQQRLEALGVVPVEEMPLVARHSRHALERAAQSQRKLPRPEVAEVVGRHRREEHHADVRRRGSMRGLLARSLLVVVDGQPLIDGPDERLEEEPRPPRQEPQARAARHVERRVRGRAGGAQPSRDFGGHHPEGEHGSRGEERGRSLPRDEPRDGQRQELRRDHVAPEDRARGAPGDPGLQVRRRGPLQQMLAGDDRAHRRPPDGVEHDERFVQQEGDGEGPARQVLPASPPVRQGGRRRREDNGQREEGRDQRGSPAGRSTPPPAAGSRTARPGCAGGCRPSSSGRSARADWRAARPGRRHAREEPRQELPVAAHPSVSRLTYTA